VPSSLEEAERIGCKLVFDPLACDRAVRGKPDIRELRDVGEDLLVATPSLRPSHRSAYHVRFDRLAYSRLRPMARNLSRRCRRTVSRSSPFNSASALPIASPVDAMAAAGSRWAPPIGSLTMPSMIPNAV